MTYKAAVSLDGKVAAQGGDARWISCLDSRRAVHELRAQADAVMVGAGTVRRDDPELTVRLSDGRDPVRVVITSDGELPPGAKLLATARKTRTIVVAREVMPTARRLLETRGAGLVEVGTEACGPRCRRSPDSASSTVLCEGGPDAGGRAPGRRPASTGCCCSWRRSSSGAACPTWSRPLPWTPVHAWRLTDVEWRPVRHDLMLSGAVVKEDS